MIGTGYIEESQLQEQLYKGEINHLFYVQHHSEEKQKAFEKYCEDNNLPQDNRAAQDFIDYELKMEEKAHRDDAM